jgi:adenylate cyclase
MFSRGAKGALLGIAVGILGSVASSTSFGLKLEEDLGLETLFRLRGHRTPPPEVVVVSIDKESSDRLDLSGKEKRWPRSLHAALTETLAHRGAAVIAFDLFFEQSGEDGEFGGDQAFAAAMRKAGNVLLCERLLTERLTMSGRTGRPGAEIEVLQRIPPFSLFGDAAAASAPYPLPKVPVKICSDWTFRTTAEESPAPTLPVVAFQWYALQVYPEFLRLLEEVFPDEAHVLPRTAEDIVRSRQIKGVIRDVREIFKKDPSAEQRMLAALDASPMRPSDPGQRRLVRSLIRLYGGGVRKFLNFYGPTHTIPTLPYHQVLRTGKRGQGPSAVEVAGRAVFVGSSESRQLAQKDGFYTVYTKENGVDLSGVEIQATSFANLVEDLPVRPLPFGWHFSGILLWGIAAGVLSMVFRPAISFPAVISFSLLYLAAAVQRFSSGGTWYPIVIPLLVQGPLALFGSVAWNYVEASRDRQNFRKAFAYYLPAGAVDELAQNFEGLKTSEKLVHGVCLATDAEQYTALSESMDPKDLARFMNRYYEAVFDPVRRHGGIVSNVVGDSMLALWLATSEAPAPLSEACLAAIEIANAMREFRKSHNVIGLPTRIGLHAGEIRIGNIGAGQHFEYRAVGDIVNTATRIEGLNKYLGTRILVSREVLPMADIFLSRDLGSFLLAGKNRPVHVYELGGLLAEASPRQKECCASFAEGMELFRRQSWEAASAKFHETLGLRDDDGPSLFFIGLCVRYLKNPPGDAWDGVVHIEKK